MTLKEKIIIREAIRILEKELSEDSDPPSRKDSLPLIRIEENGIISFVRSVTIPPEPPEPPKPLPPAPPKPLNRVF